MTSIIETYLPWLLSVITITATLMAGNKHSKAWLLSLFNQALWITWIVATSNWGFLPMTITLIIVFARNHIKWNAEPSAQPLRNPWQAPPMPAWQRSIHSRLAQDTDQMRAAPRDPGKVIRFPQPQAAYREINQYWDDEGGKRD